MLTMGLLDSGDGQDKQRQTHPGNYYSRLYEYLLYVVCIVICVCIQLCVYIYIYIYVTVMYYTS